MKDLIEVVIIGSITIFSFIVFGFILASGNCTINPGIHPKLPVVTCR